MTLSYGWRNVKRQRDEPPGPPQLRLAERHSPNLVAHEPPRQTRYVPSGGPAGSVAGTEGQDEAYQSVIVASAASALS
jgi:hypothetical protein